VSLTPLPTSAQLNLFHAQELVLVTENAHRAGGLPSWLARFVREAAQETDTLRENGAEQAAAARLALLRKLVAAASPHLDAEMDIHEAAREKGVCEETIRRAVRDGRIPDRRANPKGRHRVRRGDLDRVADAPGRPYDPTTDAQSIAQLRRKL